MSIATRGAILFDGSLRLRKQIIMIVLLFALMSAPAFTKDRDTIFGLSAAVLGPIALVAIFVGWVIFHSRNWRCPACDQNLGRAFNPRHCRICGIELRGQREARGSVR